MYALAKKVCNDSFHMITFMLSYNYFNCINVNVSFLKSYALNPFVLLLQFISKTQIRLTLGAFIIGFWYKWITRSEYVLILYFYPYLWLTDFQLYYIFAVENCSRLDAITFKCRKSKSNLESFALPLQKIAYYET
jgi:hypothetical protein